jgi:hypothetical protein
MSIIRSHLLAELTLDEILLSIRDRLLDISTTDGSPPGTPTDGVGHLETSGTDVMFDPTVDIRRHLSPILSVRSLSTLTPPVAIVSGAERRVKSFTRLPDPECSAPRHPTN